MCGIAGVVGLGTAARGAAAVQSMINTIRHRGPDDEGTYADEHVAFGMRRLNIIDLTQGHQPMWTARGTGIIFNGEIYNYRELRRELESRGARFHTQSDTEVIVHAYDLDGISCLQRLDGMFALCLYDPAAGQLHLARDRLGKKPLYYADLGGAFYFSSEIKAILAAVERRPDINRQSLHDYLTLRYVPGPDTIWRDIKKLEPATCLTFDVRRRQTALRRFWSIDFISASVEPGRDYAGEFAQLFLDAVQKRLVASDVPVGILLSGGIDSSAVAAAAVELGHKEFHSFSVAFADGGETDETPFARQVANHLGSQHAEVTVDRRQFLDFLPQFVRFTDEPLADLASVPLYYVSRLARRDVKVVLSGEGADEVLAGYDMESLARNLQRLARVSRLPKVVLIALASIVPQARWPLLHAMRRAGWTRALAEFGSHMTRVLTEAEKSALWRDPNELEPTERLIRSWYHEARSPHPIDQLQQVYCRSWLVEDLLMKADKMSMANSLELRCPFLDHHLVEWAARLPLEWKVGDATVGYKSKRVLREFARTRLPAAIIDRPKRGFPVPAYRWLENSFGAEAEDRLLSSAHLGRLFDVAAVNPLLADARRGLATAQHKVWNLLILDFWLEAWT